MQAAINRAKSKREADTDDIDVGDRKRTFNSMQSIDVSIEDMEAYRMLKVQRDDPMANLLGSDELLEYKN